MICELLENAVKIAPLGTFCVALTAIFIAWNQLRTARQNEAKKQFSSYLDDCIRNDNFLKYTGQQNGENEFYINYRYFVAKMLMAFESILEVYPKDKEWNNVINSALKHHADYLRARNSNNAKYTEKLQNIINDVIQNTPQAQHKIQKALTKEQTEELKEDRIKENENEK
jgi:hypothetical protein